jgi:hypothetical protein
LYRSGSQLYRVRYEEKFIGTSGDSPFQFDYFAAKTPFLDEQYMGKTNASPNFA